MSRPRNGNDRELGRIAEALEQGTRERGEMRDDIKEIRAGFGDLKLVIGELRQTLLRFNERTDKVEELVDGDKGIANRIFMLEAQMKDHEEVIGGFKKALWKIAAAAIGAAALSGEAGHRLVDVFLK